MQKYSDLVHRFYKAAEQAGIRTKKQARIIGEGIKNHVWIGYRIVKRRINKRGNIQKEAQIRSSKTQSSMEWILERYTVVRDDASGIVNDANGWAEESGNPRYILDLLLSVITVSTKTMEIVERLPRFEC